MSCSNFMISYQVLLLILIAVGCGPNLKSVCVCIHYADLTRGEWKVTNVVKEDQLGKPEKRLREKIKRMWPLTPTRATEEIVSQEEGGRVRRS